MPRSMQDILDHADDLAKRFEDYEPSPDDQVAVAVTDSPKPPPERVSLTFAALNRSRSAWFLVSGDGKAGAVARALDPATDLHDVPAAGVSGEAETIWFLDREAASRL